MKFSLRKKIALWMVLVGIIPAIFASLYGISVIVGRFKENINQESRKNLMISLNLMISQIDSIKEASLTLSKKTEIFNFEDQERIAQQIKKEFDYLGHGMIHILNKQGKIVNAIPLGAINWNESQKDVEAAYEKNLKLSSEMIKNTLNNYSYELDLVSWKYDGNDKSHSSKHWEKNLYVRAIAPLLDFDYNLKGAVVITISLDSLFCDNLNTVLGSNILLYAVNNNKITGFVTSLKDKDGLYPAVSPVKLDIIKKMIADKKNLVITEIKFNNTTYSAVMHALRNNKGQLVGVLAAATNISSLNKGKTDAITAVGGVTLLSFVIVLIMGTWLALKLTKPIQKLVSLSEDVSRGNMNARIEIDTNDEIGELAAMFNTMIKNLKALQDEQAAQISEMQSLHEIFNNISVKVNVKDIISSTMESVQFTLQTRSSAFVYKNEKTKEFEVLYWEGNCYEQLVKFKSGDKLLYEKVIETKMMIRIEDDDICGEPCNIIACPAIHNNDVVAVIMLIMDGESVDHYQINVIKSLAERLPMYLLNARLFEQISGFNEHLEAMVEERTKELQNANLKLEQTLKELTETQAQVLISERLAGLGTLLAGVAHEINSPISAIDTATASLTSNLRNFVDRMILLAESERDMEVITYMLTLIKNFVEEYKSDKVYRKIDTSRVKKLAALFEEIGIQKQRRGLARKFMETGADSYIETFIVTYRRIPNLITYIHFMHDFIKIIVDTGSISMSVNAVEKIIIALRTYSHVKQESPEPVNIHDIIETSLVILANKLKHKVKIEKLYSEKMPPISVYGDELSQVWTNLIINAVHAMEPDGGTITIKTEVLENNVAIHITDTGKGIPEEIIDKIFDPFFTTKKKGKGTGLGLGIVYRIVKERHGGDIKVKSRPGETTFSVILPFKVKA